MHKCSMVATGGISWRAVTETAEGEGAHAQVSAMGLVWKQMGTAVGDGAFQSVDAHVDAGEEKRDGSQYVLSK